ncbi:MAG: hypothetical protein N4J56_007249 [Chroococcidiopsis sp. SAG 2025]|uniref:hypothetical protein n=1 Tax=Chroococcidiopsis sp. SAG 2025 TaxID=171389 RepID=UPI0029370E6A|nr:hypothetical protein [Chroococcidiopsis sp. SAG 2025]MDV2997544.1 hypothetical protein [Chroococcidiopsis sp. SAG 2025]
MTYINEFSHLIATSASKCDRSMQVELLTDPKIYEHKLVGYRYKVCLVSKELELDGWENPVPKDTKIIDIVVSEPTRSAIEQLVAATGRPDYWQLVSFWQPEDEAPF